MASQQVTMKVTGMTCGGCVNAVRSIIKSVDGVSSVSVDLETERANFEFDAGETNLKHIMAEVEDLGYGASVIGATQ